jgi:type VI secretion system secreted protein Hcp
MAVDMTIKIDSIKGESKLKDHTEEIDILAWSWGLSQSGTFGSGGGGGAGKVNAQDLSLTKWVDKASPELMIACSNGKHIKDAVLTVRKAGEKPLEYLTITLEKILVSSISTGGSGGEDRLTENVTLNFAKAKVEYQEQDEKGGPKGGKVTYSYDFEQNVKP